jgi:hypothetical protein
LPIISRGILAGEFFPLSFRGHDDRRPSKFIVLADNMKSAIKMAWEDGGPDFQSRFDKSTAQAEQMKEERFAFCEPLGATYLGDPLTLLGICAYTIPPYGSVVLSHH